MNILDQIVSFKRREIESVKRARPLAELKEVLSGLPPARDFRAALRRRRCAIIAEVKRSSPSRGRLVDAFDPVETAKIYDEGGAAAISVLTERNFFEGDGSFLGRIKQVTGVPLLRKDFIIDSYQIYETMILGGDALLLIAGLLEIVQLSEFIGIADELGITSLVEVHDPGQLEKALRAGAQVIGINNRNLRTFETDLKTTLDLLPSIPQGVIAVSESGIRSRLDVELLMRGGVHAFLVGEALMSSADVPKKIRELAGT
jgi:indole-3-glycerol phosphate synthase